MRDSDPAFIKQWSIKQNKIIYAHKSLNKSFIRVGHWTRYLMFFFNHK